MLPFLHSKQEHLLNIMTNKNTQLQSGFHINSAIQAEVNHAHIIHLVK